MKRTRLKPWAFLEAAELLQEEIDKGSPDLGYACVALEEVLKIHKNFYSTKEYKLFSKLFEPVSLFPLSCWFGSPVNDYYQPHKKNQELRIQALLFCYEEAKRIR